MFVIETIINGDILRVSISQGTGGLLNRVGWRGD
jgi:hypothetical protein